VVARRCKGPEVTATSRWPRSVLAKYKNLAALSSPIEGEDAKN
jgi:hypothetical protein